MTTIEALQELYISLGGNIDDVLTINTIPEMIEAIRAIPWSGYEDFTPISTQDVSEIIETIGG